MSELPPISLLPRDVETAVRERYGAAAREHEEALCCPTSYAPALLAALPSEVIERDYGCTAGTGSSCGGSLA